MQLWRVGVTPAALVAARGPSLDQAAGSGGPSAVIAAAILARLRSMSAFGTRAFGRP